MVDSHNNRTRGKSVNIYKSRLNKYTDISTSLISNNRLSRSENLIPA